MKVKIPRTWVNGQPLTDREMMHCALLRLGGCPCELPLLGFVMADSKIRGVRCRVCCNDYTWDFQESEPV